jgi:hypothetical protein
MRNGRESRQSRCVKIEINGIYIYIYIYIARLWTQTSSEKSMLSLLTFNSVPVPELKILNQKVRLLTVNMRHIVSTAGYELNQDYRGITI